MTALKHTTRPSLKRSLLAVALAVSAGAFSSGAHAMAHTGDASPAELPWVRPAAELIQTEQHVHAASAAEATAAAPGTSLSRAEVREALADARNADLMPGVSDIGDTNEMLARREVFYALQTEVMQAELDRAAEAARLAAAVTVTPGETMAEAEVFAELQAYEELHREGAHPAMLRPSANGTVITDAQGRETLVVEIDD